MAFLFGSIPYFKALVRREYTLNLRSGHGEYIPAIVHGVRCVRGHSLWFQCMLMGDKYGGCAFLLPIQALVWKPCEAPPDMTYQQPWDVFSSTFTATTLDLVAKGAVYILPAAIPGQYQFTIDFTGSDLADDVEQHKHLHVCFLENGLVGAFPNNRILWRDDAFWTLAPSKPTFASLDREFRAEGNQSMCAMDPLALGELEANGWIDGPQPSAG